MKHVRLRQPHRDGSEELELPIPDGWNIEICHMAGHQRPALKSAEIGAAIAHPLGCPPIRELARGKKKVVIIFDDNSRATRVDQIVPFILAELAAADIPDSSIRFMAATGCHNAMNRLDFVKKLGEEVLHRFPVYNHNPFGDCKYVGTTSHGTEIYANAEVVSCDFKIAIGSVVPHIMAGFGGGAKIIMPGIASIETTEAYHRSGKETKEKNNGKLFGMGIIEDNPRQQNIKEAAAMVGLDIKIDAILNTQGETVALYPGKPESAYSAAVQDARRHYLTPRARDKDIVIANTFAKASEAECGLTVAFPSVTPRGGDVVLISNDPKGHIQHYLMGPWGTALYGNLPLQIDIPPNVNRLAIFSQYPELATLGYFQQKEKVFLITRWDDVLALLKSSHGDNTQVAVYPAADIQYGK